MKSLFSKLLLGVLVVLCFPAAAVTEPALKIAVLAFRPKAQALEQWQPLASYLAKELGQNIELMTYSYQEFESAISKNQVDIVLTNPAHYILLRRRNSLSAPLATQITRKGEHKLTAFGGVIFTRQDNSSITSLADISSYTIAATKAESLGGYKMQAYELFDANLAKTSRSKLMFTGMPHDRVVEAVLAGDADIGFVRSGLLESMANEGKILLNQVKIINQQNLPSYPFLTSTRIYPEWPVAVMPTINETLARRLTVALLSLPADHPVAINANIYGFTIPASYSDVEELLRSLRLEPFNAIPKITLPDLWFRYSNSIISIGLLSLMLLGISIRWAVQNRRVQYSQKSLLATQDELESTLNAIPDMMFEVGLDGTYYSVRTPFSHLLIRPKEELLGRRVQDHMNPIASATCLAALEEANNQGFSSNTQFHQEINGTDKWFELSIAKKSDSSKDQPRFVVLSRDITERKKSEKKLHLSSQVFNHTHEGIIITDSKGVIIDVNPAFSEISGFSREEAINNTPKILSSGRQSREFYKDLWETLHQQGCWQGEVWNCKKNGDSYAELLTISVLKDDANKVINYIALFRDITHNKQQHEQLSLMAHYDLLTNLPNRALFADRFNQATAHSKRTTTQLAICFLDLDNFKPVNDTYGHDVGDQLLIEVAQRIKSNIREEDTVSRQGGDEFTLLLGDFTSLTPCEQTLKRILSTLAKPYQVNNQSITISASLGVAFYQPEGSDIDTLIRHADQAMYQAKLAGKNRYHLFNSEQEQLLSKKNQRLNEIQQALLHNEFKLYYQPKVNMSTGKVYGTEALIRWIHPEKGLIPPLDFLPLIEETQLEILIGEWVIEQALAQIESWKKQGLSLKVSVNIASYHLQSVSFISQLTKALSKHPTVNPNNLQLEILESSSLGDTQIIRNIIQSCQNTLGVKVALDDFGTGYSSLTHLRNLPAETIKIDQSFVRDILDDPGDYTIVNGIIGLANSFNREVVAEGVETTEQGLMLLLMGCHQAQGYGIARPMPADDISNWLSSYIPNNDWLNCINTEINKKTYRTKLLQLVIKQWEKRVTEIINAPPEQSTSWPILDARKCPCGVWVKLEKKDSLFSPAWTAELAQAHEQAHSVANRLKDHHQKKQLKLANHDLYKLKEAFKKMYDLLKHPL